MATHSILQVVSSLFCLLVSVATILLLFLSCADVCISIPCSMVFIKSQAEALDFIVSVMKFFIAIIDISNI